MGTGVISLFPHLHTFDLISLMVSVEVKHHERSTRVTRLAVAVDEVFLYVHRDRRLIRDGGPGRPPRLSHSSFRSSVAVAYHKVAVILSSLLFQPL